MKKIRIRNTMHSLHVLLLAALLLVGCVREEFPDSGAVAEGKPSQIALNLIVPEMNGHPVTRALTPDEETKINDIPAGRFDFD